ncbi:hypothetical protein RIF29_31579 [Crotalaria pallida]|uniref:Uncharacterized protein n=1 Tax=Crotalaria pallida TaxID=3830 RepID=A0AAN9EPG7_CROPI
MGNCLRNNKLSSSQDHENYESQVAPSSVDVKVDEKIKASSSLSKLEAPEQKEQGMKKKKKVRFNIQNDDDDDRGSCHGNSRSSGVVRIKVVMTQKELKRMLLSCKKDEQHTTTSLEQLLSVVKLRGGRISEVCEFNGGMNSWRPALQSIPEDPLIFNNPSM